MSISLEATIQLLGLVGVMWGLFYTSKQIKHAAHVNNVTLDWNRKTYTEDKLENKPDINVTLKLEKTFRTKDSLETIPLKFILETIEKEPEFQLHIRYKLNRYERLARGIRFGVIDEAIVKNALNVHMVKDFLNYGEYVEHLQRCSPTGGLEEFSSLMNKWRKDKDLGFLFDYNKQKRESTINA